MKPNQNFKDIINYKKVPKSNKLIKQTRKDFNEEVIKQKEVNQFLTHKFKIYELLEACQIIDPVNLNEMFEISFLMLRYIFYSQRDDKDQKRDRWYYENLFGTDIVNMKFNDYEKIKSFVNIILKMEKNAQAFSLFKDQLKICSIERSKNKTDEENIEFIDTSVKQIKQTLRIFNILMSKQFKLGGFVFNNNYRLCTQDERPFSEEIETKYKVRKSMGLNLDGWDVENEWNTHDYLQIIAEFQGLEDFEKIMQKTDRLNLVKKYSPEDPTLDDYKFNNILNDIQTLEEWNDDQVQILYDLSFKVKDHSQVFCKIVKSLVQFMNSKQFKQIKTNYFYRVKNAFYQIDYFYRNMRKKVGSQIVKNKKLTFLDVANSETQKDLQDGNLNDQLPDGHKWKAVEKLFVDSLDKQTKRQLLVIQDRIFNLKVQMRKELADQAKFDHYQRHLDDLEQFIHTVKKVNLCTLNVKEISRQIDQEKSSAIIAANLRNNIKLNLDFGTKLKVNLLSGMKNATAVKKIGFNPKLIKLNIDLVTNEKLLKEAKKLLNEEKSKLANQFINQAKNSKIGKLYNKYQEQMKGFFEIIHSKLGYMNYHDEKYEFTKLMQQNLLAIYNFINVDNPEQLELQFIFQFNQIGEVSTLLNKWKFCDWDQKVIMYYFRIFEVLFDKEYEWKKLTNKYILENLFMCMNASTTHRFQSHNMIIILKVQQKIAMKQDISTQSSENGIISILITLIFSNDQEPEVTNQAVFICIIMSYNVQISFEINRKNVQNKVNSMFYNENFTNIMRFQDKETALDETQDIKSFNIIPLFIDQQHTLKPNEQKLNHNVMLHLEDSLIQRITSSFEFVSLIFDKFDFYSVSNNNLKLNTILTDLIITLIVYTKVQFESEHQVDVPFMELDNQTPEFMMSVLKKPHPGKKQYEQIKNKQLFTINMKCQNQLRLILRRFTITKYIFNQTISLCANFLECNQILYEKETFKKFKISEKCDKCWLCQECIQNKVSELKPEFSAESHNCNNKNIKSQNKAERSKISLIEYILQIHSVLILGTDQFQQNKMISALIIKSTFLRQDKNIFELNPLQANRKLFSLFHNDQVKNEIINLIIKDYYKLDTVLMYEQEEIQDWDLYIENISFTAGRIKNDNIKIYQNLKESPLKAKDTNELMQVEKLIKKIDSNFNIINDTKCNLIVIELCEYFSISDKFYDFNKLTWLVEQTIANKQYEITLMVLEYYYTYIHNQVVKYKIIFDHIVEGNKGLHPFLNQILDIFKIFMTLYQSIQLDIDIHSELDTSAKNAKIFQDVNKAIEFIFDILKENQTSIGDLNILPKDPIAEQLKLFPTSQLSTKLDFNEKLEKLKERVEHLDKLKKNYLAGAKDIEELEGCEKVVNDTKPQSETVRYGLSLSKMKYNFLKKGYNISSIDKSDDNANFFMIREFFEDMIFKIIREFQDAFQKSAMQLELDTHKQLFANASRNNPIIFLGDEMQYSTMYNKGSKLIYPAKRKNMFTGQPEDTQFKIVGFDDVLVLRQEIELSKQFLIILKLRLARMSVSETVSRTILFKKETPLLSIDQDQNNRLNKNELTGIFLTLHIGFKRELRFKTNYFEGEDDQDINQEEFNILDQYSKDVNALRKPIEFMILRRQIQDEKDQSYHDFYQLQNGKVFIAEIDMRLELMIFDNFIYELKEEQDDIHNELSKDNFQFSSVQDEIRAEMKDFKFNFNYLMNDKIGKTPAEVVIYLKIFDHQNIFQDNQLEQLGNDNSMIDKYRQAWYLRQSQMATSILKLLSPQFTHYLDKAEYIMTKVDIVQVLRSIIINFKDFYDQLISCGFDIWLTDEMASSLHIDSTELTEIQYNELVLTFNCLK